MSRTRDPEGTDSVALEIIHAIASAAGTEPEELETPLYEVVDLEALERVVRSDSLTHVAFEYEDYVVEIDDLGFITVEDKAGDSVRQSIASVDHSETATGRRERL